MSVKKSVWVVEKELGYSWAIFFQTLGGRKNGAAKKYARESILRIGGSFE